MWSKILAFLKKLWRVLRKVLAIVLISLAVYFTFGGALTILGATFSGGWAALLAGGLAFIVDAQTSTEVISTVGDGVAAAAGAASKAVSGVVNSVVSNSGVLGLAAIGFGLWFFLSRREKKTGEQATDPSLMNGAPL